MSIKFVIGLGNPEQKYFNTPHNLGRTLVEVLQAREKLSWKKERAYDYTESSPSYVRLHTYMNVSGEAVQKLFNRFGAKPEEILICCDDFDLPLGTIRLRKKGSAGSHNGLKSIIQLLNTQEFPRLRMGFGPIPPNANSITYVLKPFAKENYPAVKEMLEKATQAIDTMHIHGIDPAMNQFNQTQTP